MDIIFEDGWEAVIWLNAVECAVDFIGNCTGVFEVKDVAFEAGGFVEALEYRRFWEIYGFWF